MKKVWANYIAVELLNDCAVIHLDVYEHIHALPSHLLYDMVPLLQSLTCSAYTSECYDCSTPAEVLLF